MSAERTEMIKSLNEFFVPELRNLKFKGSFPHFRKTINGKTNLLTFQFDRNGGGFIIEIANWHESEFETHWGKIIPLNKLTAHDLDPNLRKRIYPQEIRKESEKETWFRFDKKGVLNFGNKYHKLSKKVLEKLPLMNEFWNKTETK